MGIGHNFDILTFEMKQTCSLINFEHISINGKLFKAPSWTPEETSSSQLVQSLVQFLRGFFRSTSEFFFKSFCSFSQPIFSIKMRSKDFKEVLYWSTLWNLGRVQVFWYIIHPIAFQETACCSGIIRACLV